MTITLGEIAKHIGANLIGDPDCIIEKVATLSSAQPGSISFLSNRRYTRQLATTKASAVILDAGNVESNPGFSLVTENPYLGFASVVNLLYPKIKPQPGIHKSAVIAVNADIDTTASIGPNVVIGENSRIEKNVEIGAGCVIENEVVIGADTKLFANVVLLEKVQIGARVILYPGVIIGSDGFGLANDNGTWLKIPQLGCVIIKDDVEIGANSSIDRGAIEDTIIETGVKIDNQVQIGHNVHIGEHTAIAGCVGIAGSTTIGKRCMIGGAVGISGHINITDDVIVTAMSGIANSIKEPGVYSSGIPAIEARTWRKNVAGLKHLFKLISRVNKLEKKS